MASDGPSTVGGVAPTRTLQLIQVLRAVAALMVVVHHASIMLHERLDAAVRPWRGGAAGVDIFFVISGLVMTLSSEALVGRVGAAGTFLVRRLERIVPMYWLVTTLKVALVLLLPTMALHGLGGVWHVVASYLFLLAMGPDGPQPVLIVGWTLCYEMLFYGVFAAVLGLGMPLVRTVSVVLVGLSVVGVLLRSTHEPVVLLVLQPLMLEFLLGMLLAKVWTAGWVPKAGWAAGLMVAGWAVLLTMPEGSTMELRALCWGVPAAAIVGGALGLERKLGRLAPRWLLETGDASYSLYLTHGLVLPLAGVVAVRLPGLGVAGWGAVSLVACVLVGEGCYRLLELPMIRWFKGRRRTAIPAVAG